MNWEDEGFLLAKRKFRENANIIDVFTISNGKISGIVYGGNSRKIRNYLQIGNKIFVIHNSKNDNKIGYLKTELIEPISPKFFGDKKRTSAILSLTFLLNKLLPESQPYNKIYNSLIELYRNFEHDNWIILYIFWELNLIRELGYGTNLFKFSDSNLKNYDLANITVDNVNFTVPYFIINQKIPDEVANNLILKSLSFTRSILQSKFFLPNNIIFPKSRIILENYYN